MEFFEKDVKFSFLERIIPEHDAKGARRNKGRELKMGKIIVTQGAKKLCLN
jgi:hypothetical protein